MNSAAEALTIALLEIADQGKRTPCQGRRRDRWTSDSAEDRGWAAAVCVTLACPVQTECGAAADEQGEKHHTWGGRDRAAAPTRRRGEQ